MRIRFILLGAILMTITALSCGKSRTILTDAELKTMINSIADLEFTPVEESEIAVLETSLGTIKFEFYPDAAPRHCANFKRLANAGIYDGVLFHRVISGFMIQTGSLFSKNGNPMDDGGGDPGFTLDAEFSDISHERGIVSTARRGDSVNSASTQFFIMHQDYSSLDGKYTVFGKVIEGMDVVDAIAASPTTMKTEQPNDRPLNDIVLISARVVKQ